jgi:hypothetical protein
MSTGTLPAWPSRDKLDSEDEKGIVTTALPQNRALLDIGWVPLVQAAAQ